MKIKVEWLDDATQWTDEEIRLEEEGNTEIFATKCSTKTFDTIEEAETFADTIHPAPATNVVIECVYNRMEKDLARWLNISLDDAVQWYINHITEFGKERTIHIIENLEVAAKHYSNS